MKRLPVFGFSVLLSLGVLVYTKKRCVQVSAPVYIVDMQEMVAHRAQKLVKGHESYGSNRTPPQISQAKLDHELKRIQNALQQASQFYKSPIYTKGQVFHHDTVDLTKHVLTYLEKNSNDH